MLDTVLCRAVPLIVAGLTMGAAATDLAGQTDYYNTDAGRPVRIEDAHPTERYAFELQLAPLRLERERGGVYSWGVEPEIAYGILPRTHLEIGFPLLLRDAAGAGSGSLGLGGIEVSALHNLNVETRTLPALGVAAEVVLPVGQFHADKPYPTLKGIATRTFELFRMHVNGQYTFGSVPEAGLGTADHGEMSRWMAGVAVDKTFPLKSALLIADVYAQEPLEEGAELEWNAGAGIRYQISPRLAIDAGIGKRLTGENQSWSFTLGSAYAFGLRSLIPVSGR